MAMKWTLAGAGALVLGGGLFLLSGPGKDLRNLWRHGVLQAAVDDPGADRKYSASRAANLKEIYIALDLYQDSEGQYPPGKSWMDAIQTRLHTNDMSNEEAIKKLIRPNIAQYQPGEYGYAINAEVAGKFKGDIKDGSTPLVFESSDLSKNAVGSPSGQKGRMAVTVAGKVTTL